MFVDKPRSPKATVYCWSCCPPMSKSSIWTVLSFLQPQAARLQHISNNLLTLKNRNVALFLILLVFPFQRMRSICLGHIWQSQRNRPLENILNQVSSMQGIQFLCTEICWILLLLVYYCFWLFWQCKPFQKTRHQAEILVQSLDCTVSAIYWIWALNHFYLLFLQPLFYCKMCWARTKCILIEHITIYYNL